MNEQQNTEVVKQAYEAFGTGNIPALLDTFTENIEWRTPTVEGSPFQEVYNGREAVAQFFKTIDEHENFTQFEPREFIAQDDKVVVLGALTSTVNNTGREYQTDWVHIFTVRDGKITDFKEFFDTAAASKAFKKLPVHNQ